MRIRIQPLLMLAVLAGCGSGGTDSDTRTAAKLEAVSGADQQGTYGQAAPAPLVVLASDADGRPVRGATVRWTAANGTLATNSSVTDASGTSSNTWTLATSDGVQIATASVNGAAPVVFTARARGTLPAVVRSCETNTATLCADWRLVNGQYVADWAQGSHAVIDATLFTPESVLFTRNDPSGTSAGMYAVYRGTPVNNSVVGTVTWSRNGVTVSGHWTANW
jgi:hypothetical protein